MNGDVIVIAPDDLARIVGKAIDEAVARVAVALDAASQAPAVADPCDLFSSADLCRLLKVNRATLRRMELMGELPAATRIASRCVRWRRSAIEKWIAESTPEALRTSKRLGSVRRVKPTGETK